MAFESCFRKKTFRCSIHTHPSFYFRKSTFMNTTSSIRENFLLHSCDWPITAMQKKTGKNTRSDVTDWSFMLWVKCDFGLNITTNVVVVVKLKGHSQYSSAHEATPLLACKFLSSTRLLASVSCSTSASKLRKFAGKIHKKLSRVIGFSLYIVYGQKRVVIVPLIEFSAVCYCAAQREWRETILSSSNLINRCDLLHEKTLRLPAVALLPLTTKNYTYQSITILHDLRNSYQAGY